MIVLVCGGRTYRDAKRLYAELDAIHYYTEITLIVHGAARGADTLARGWAYSREVPCDEYPANWRQHHKNAGPIRNQQMLDEAKPDLVVAFPGGPGTADMIRRATSANIPLKVIVAHKTE